MGILPWKLYGRVDMLEQIPKSEEMEAKGK
jgi:hypothetical protein